MSDLKQTASGGQPASGCPADEARIGVYICHCGGNISDHVDVEAVRERMEKMPGVTVSRTNMFMCSDPGQESIMEDLKSGLVNRVVVASCAPSLHETTFRAAIARAGGNPYQYEHANIREQVSWVHHGAPATDKATRLISAAAGKARLLTPLTPIRVEAQRRALVIGGGVAGMRAALDLAAQGVRTDLIELSPYLGGGLARLDKLAPHGEDAAGIVRELAGNILSDPLITTHCQARLTAFGGYVGKFSVEISPASRTARAQEAAPGAFVPGKGVLGPAQAPGAPERFDAGAVVMATGFSSYAPQKGEYGFGDNAEAVTLPRFIEELKNAQTAPDGMLRLGSRPVRSLAIIHCVGSRQIPGVHEEGPSGHLNEHCSRTCCAASINAALTVRKTFPATRVYELYRDIRTYGRGQEEMYAEASAEKVTFLRFDVESPPEVVRVNGQYPLEVRVRDELTFGENLELPVDLVVLATGMEPAPIRDLIDMLKLPVGADRFLLETHPKLRPVELPVAGVYLAGTCQAPMDAGEAANAASSAAAKAGALLRRGFVELDPFVAEVDPARCKGTGACVDACLNEGALRLQETEIGGEKVMRAVVTPALCLGCGACAAVCPEGAINVSGWTLEQYEAMVDMILSEAAFAVTADESVSASPEPAEAAV